MRQIPPARTRGPPTETFVADVELELDRRGPILRNVNDAPLRIDRLDL